MPFPSRINPATLGSEALAVVERTGWESWSLREVAAAVGVTPNALYRHVDGREGLHIAIGAAAARELLVHFQAVDVATDPLEDAVRLSHAYVSFAVLRPDAYRAFMTAKPDPTHSDAAEWIHVWHVFAARVSPNAPNAADALCLALWALLHGRVDLALTAARYTAADVGLDHGVRALITGYRAGGAQPSPLPAFLASA